MNILVYSFPSCSRCTVLKKLLNDKNVEYKEIMHTETGFHGMYPHIFVDGRKVAYHTFLQELREGDIK